MRSPFKCHVARAPVYYCAVHAAADGRSSRHLNYNTPQSSNNNQGFYYSCQAKFNGTRNDFPPLEILGNTTFNSLNWSLFAHNYLRMVGKVQAVPLEVQVIWNRRSKTWPVRFPVTHPARYSTRQVFFLVISHF